MKWRGRRRRWRRTGVSTGPWAGGGGGVHQGHSEFRLRYSVAWSLMVGVHQAWSLIVCVNMECFGCHQRCSTAGGHASQANNTLVGPFCTTIFDTAATKAVANALFWHRATSSSGCCHADCGVHRKLTVGYINTVPLLRRIRPLPCVPFSTSAQLLGALGCCNLAAAKSACVRPLTTTSGAGHHTPARSLRHRP